MGRPGLQRPRAGGRCLALLGVQNGQVRVRNVQLIITCTDAEDGLESPRAFYARFNNWENLRLNRFDIEFTANSGGRLGLVRPQGSPTLQWDRSGAGARDRHGLWRHGPGRGELRGPGPRRPVPRRQLTGGAFHLGAHGGECPHAPTHQPGCPVPAHGGRPDLRACRRPGGVRPVHRPRRRTFHAGRLPPGQRAASPAARVQVAPGRGSVQPRPALLDRGPGLRSRLPHPRVRCPAAGQRRPPGRGRGPHLRPPAGPPPTAVGAVPDPRARGWPRGAADEDPPLGGGWRVGQRAALHPARPESRGAGDPAGPAGQRRRAGAR